MVKNMNAKIDLREVTKGFDMEQKGAEKAIKRTVGDMKSRAPGWVSKAVREEYGRAAKDVKGAMHTENGGSMNFKGAEVDAVALVYKGRVLTPTHFKMKPASRPPKPYSVTAEVRKGQRKTLSSIAFLSHSGGSESKEIPFQRRGAARTPIDAIKTLSVPQMIESKQGIKPKDEKVINEKLEKRFEHHCEQALKK